MSLKAKIEAVIYASEEPVTLAQLTGLLGHEAQAELDHLDAAQQTLRLDAAEGSEDEPSLDQDALNGEVLSEEADVKSAESAQPAAPVEAEAALAEQGIEPDAAISEAATAEVSAPEAIAPARESGEARAEKEKARRLREYFRSILDSLIADYASNNRGIEIREVAGGFRLSTKPEYHDAVRGFVKSLKPPLKLSLQALETLAVVAYKQPVTAPEISEIRGVDTGGVLGSLMARKLITTAGRKQVIGRPILYKTTKDFLLRFGLKDVNELPSIEEFEKMAGELADAEPLQEEIVMSSDPASITEANLEEERESIEPQADGDPTDIDTVPVDGRISGQPPSYESDDPSAEEAKVQDEENQSDETGRQGQHSSE
jgi:segregation and condensation protein B